MKRITMISTLTSVLLLTAFAVVRADTRGRHGWCNHLRHQRGPAGFLAHKMNLSDAQKTQIQGIWRAEQPIFSGQIRDLLEENKEMNAISARDNPDPAEVQKLANREASTIASLLMEKARLQSKVYSTVLTSNQRTKADELQKNWESQLDRFADRFAIQSSGR